MEENCQQNREDTNRGESPDVVVGREPVRLRDNLYSKINVSLNTMNLIIAGLCITLAVFLAYGIWQANVR